MMITSAQLTHVRGIRGLQLHLATKTTMLFGRPGTGKSTVLDALSVALAATARHGRPFEKRDACADAGEEPSVKVHTALGSNWRRTGIDPTRTRIDEMAPEDAAAAAIVLSGRRARPIKPDGLETAGSACWRRAVEAARGVLEIGDAGPFDPGDAARWSHGQAKVMEIFTSTALALRSRYADADNPLAGAGVAVIDDIDAMLHIGIQQTLLPTFRDTFPNVQVICATHSPFVLATAEPGGTVELSRDGERVKAHYRKAV